MSAALLQLQLAYPFTNITWDYTFFTVYSTVEPTINQMAQQSPLNTKGEGDCYSSSVFFPCPCLSMLRFYCLRSVLNSIK